jgi:hypothetical protein
MENIAMNDSQATPVYIVKKKTTPTNHTAGFGTVFFLIGQMIPYWSGDHHDPGAQIVFGAMAGIIGITIGFIINWRIREKS